MVGGVEIYNSGGNKMEFFFSSILGNALGIALIGVVGYVFYTKLYPALKDKFGK